MERKVNILLTMMFFLFSGCATTFDTKGRFHEVRRGDNIWTIAKAYRIDAQTLAEYNNIEDPRQIAVGQKLYVPRREKKPGYKRILDEAEGRRSFRRGERKKRETTGDEKSIHVQHGRFLWPVEGRIMSGFGWRNGSRHDGIDIAAHQGTPIKAADEGKVIFAGTMRGYGNLILLRHEDDFLTAYAHNSVNLAKKGTSVKRGDVIGKVGRTGRATGPHLHFEVRHGQTARNPLFFLPKQ